MAGSDGHTGFAELIGLVGKVAPVLGSVLGSPIGGVASIAVSLLARLFGVTGNDIGDISAAISQDPEATEKLKTLEYQHQEALAALASQDFLAEEQDRDSARKREVATKDHMPMFLAMAVLLVYAIVQIIAIYSPEHVDDIISARVQDIFVIIISYYFGSSHRGKQGVQ